MRSLLVDYRYPSNEIGLSVVSEYSLHLYRYVPSAHRSSYHRLGLVTLLRSGSISYMDKSKKCESLLGHIPPKPLHDDHQRGHNHSICRSYLSPGEFLASRLSGCTLTMTVLLGVHVQMPCLDYSLRSS